MMNDRQPTVPSREDGGPGAERTDHHRVYRRALDWVDRHHGDPVSRGQREHGQGLLSASLAISLRLHLHTVREVSGQDRMAWGEYLKACQNVDTGFFVDPRVGIPGAAGGVGPTGDDDALTRLVTCFVLQVLKFSARPRRPAFNSWKHLPIDVRLTHGWKDWTGRMSRSRRNR